MRFRWLKLYVYVVLFLLFFPLILVILFSFNSNRLSVFPLTGFTLDWYYEVLTQKIYIEGFKNSIIVAMVTSLGSVLLGTLGAYGLNRHKIPGSGLFLSTLTLPILIPGLVLGIGMLSYFSLLKISLSLTSVILAHIVFSTPYVILIMNSRFHDFDWSIEEAARDLGAKAWDRFRYILFPLIRPSIFGSILLVFAISIDEFVVTYFVIGNQSTMPMIMWSILKRGVSPTLNAISAILFIVSAILLFLAFRVFRVRLDI